MTSKLFPKSFEGAWGNFFKSSPKRIPRVPDKPQFADQIFTLIISFFSEISIFFEKRYRCCCKKRGFMLQ
jgi:hypothetical protein